LILLAIPAGLEPATLCLEGRCSIQLSYGTGLEIPAFSIVRAEPNRPKREQTAKTADRVANRCRSTVQSLSRCVFCPAPPEITTVQVICGPLASPSCVMSTP